MNVRQGAMGSVWLVVGAGLACSSAAPAGPSLEGRYEATSAGSLSELTFSGKNEYSLQRAHCSGQGASCVEAGTYSLNATRTVLSLTSAASGETTRLPFGTLAITHATSDPLHVLGGGPLSSTPDGGVALTQESGPLIQGFTAGGQSFDDQLAIPCVDAVSDVYLAPSPLPDFHQGNVIRCAKDRTLASSDVDTAARRVGYSGPTLGSGTTVYRIAFQTNRVLGSDGTTAQGISSALVFLPDHPIATAGPLVVAGHGSVGIASSCAPSLGDLTGSGNFLDDAHSLALPLAGYGYTVVMPDYAGFGYGSTTGWLLSEDEAHSLLDSTRAMAEMLTSGTLSDDVVLVGHSQGGHAVLSAQSYAGSYGLAGNLVGVVAEAPLWIADRAWGAGLTDLLVWRPTVTIGELVYAVQYFYGHGEVYDGPGKGASMFQSSKQDGIRKAVSSECLDTLGGAIGALGQKPADLFSTGFSTAVANCADTSVCLGSTASTWETRWKADRPDEDANGADLVVMFGGDDQTVTPSFAACAIDRIDKDFSQGGSASKTYCFDPTAIHGAEAGGSVDSSTAITRRNADWINHWIAAKTTGAPPPAACAPWTGKAGNGSSISCPHVPSNTD